ncbi:MAG: hypothetical protein GY718_10080 [Lentisphaerae bacterium]|nr:hypothetical protein [Lentisphaerota bacterium]
MKYHVTKKWDGENLECAADYMGEDEAIDMFCEKWGTEDGAFAGDQVHKIFAYNTIAEAKEHQKDWGGQILAINDEFLEFDEDWTEGHPVLYTRGPIETEYITVV